MTPDLPAPDTALALDGSRRHRQRALRHLAFGVSSTPRGRQQPVPLAIDRAEGVHLFDVDGNRYIDYALGYGPLFLGHSPAPVLDAVRRQLDRGLRTASIHEAEAELAEEIAACIPSAEVSAFVSSGSEAVQLALRLARAGTGRTRIVKFRGNYHGWFDSVHVAGAPGEDGPVTLGQDPAASAAVTVLDWGDADALDAVLTPEFAAVLLEPAAINGGCFAPPPGFLERVRAATARTGTVLVFDEVLTGFRLGLGGAQERYGVAADLLVLGKTLGAGLPIAAVSGPAAFMEPIMSGRLMHRGTYNGHPLSTAAGVACLRHLRAHAAEIFPRAERQAAAIRQHVLAESARAGVRMAANQLGPVVQLFAGIDQVPLLADVAGVDRPGTARFAAELLHRGVFIIPRGVMYLSAVHGDADIHATLDAITAAFDRLQA